ncbi:hypothetical protein BH09SUM1_BH09SUM1_09310 [soil metagenome]
MAEQNDQKEKPFPIAIVMLIGAVLLFFALWWSGAIGPASGTDRGRGAPVKVVVNIADREADKGTQGLLPGEGYTPAFNTRAGRTPTPSAPEFELAYPATHDLETSTAMELAATLKPGELIGWVSDARSQPIVQAHVSLTFEDKKTAADKIPKLEATSSETGLFKISGIPPGIWTVVAEKSGYAKDALAGVEIGSNERHEPIELKLGPELKVTGTVTAADHPVNRASVSALREHLSVHPGGVVERVKVNYASAQTSEKGQFELKQLPAGKIQIDVRADGFAPLDVDLVVNDKTPPLKLMLTPESLLSGVVRNELGKPVKGAELSIRLPGSPDKDPPYGETKSLDDGSFVFRMLPERREFLLTAKAEGYAVAGPITILSGTSTNVIVMTTGGAIMGLVTAFDSGAPRSDIGVLAINEDPARNIRLWTKTNSSGRYKISLLPAGSYHVSIYNDRLTSEPRPAVKVDGVKAVKDVNFAIYPGLNIDGNVVDGETGEPIANAEVTLESKVGPSYLLNKNTKAIANEAGSFRFADLPLGVYTMRGSLKGYMAAPGEESSARIELIRGDLPQPVEIKLFRAGVIDGSVTDRAGAGVAGALVQLYHGAGSPGRIDLNPFKATTDASGAFSIESIPVQAELFLIATASKEGLGKAKSDVIVLSPRQPVASTQIEFGASQSVQVFVRQEEAGGLQDATVVITSSNFPDAAPAFWTQKTGMDGYATFEDFPAGGGRVTASKDGFLPASKAITVSADAPQQVELVLTPSRLLTGRVVDDSGVPIQAGSVTARPESGARGSGSSGIAADSTFRITTLGLGYFTLDTMAVRATKYGGRNVAWAISRQMPNGGIGDVIITVPMSGVLEGKVLQPDDNQPPAKYTVSLSATYKDDAGKARTFGTSCAFEQGSDFLFESLPPGQYTVTASAPNYLPVTVGPVKVSSPGVASAGTIPLETSGQLKLKMVNARTQEPISGAIATLSPKGPALWTNASGDGTFNPVMPEMYTLKVAHGDFLPFEKNLIKVSRGKVTDLGPLEMEPGAILFGAVTDGKGGAVASAVVQAQSANVTSVKRTTTDSGGRYSLHGLVPGGQVVTYSGRVNSRDVSASLEVTVSSLEKTEQNVSLTADATLIATLGAPPGVDPSRALVTLYLLRANSVPSISAPIRVDTISRGQFMATKLARGYYLVTVQAPGTGGLTYWASTAAVLNDDNYATIAAGPMAFTGRVLKMKDGDPVAAQSIRFDLLSAPQSAIPALRRWWEWTARTDATGQFAFRNLPQGTYSFVAQNEALGSDILEIIQIDGERLITRRDFDFGSNKSQLIPERKNVIFAETPRSLEAPLKDAYGQ